MAAAQVAGCGRTFPVGRKQELRLLPPQAIALRFWEINSTANGCFQYCCLVHTITCISLDDLPYCDLALSHIDVAHQRPSTRVHFLSLIYPHHSNHAAYIPVLTKSYPTQLKSNPNPNTTQIKPSSSKHNSDTKPDHQTLPSSTMCHNRRSGPPPLIALGAAMFGAYQERRNRRSGAIEIPEAAPFLAQDGSSDSRTNDKAEADVPPPDYEDVISNRDREFKAESKGEKRGDDGSDDEHRLSDSEHSGEKVEGEKMGFFQRMQAKKEAKRAERRAWMDGRRGRGWGGRGRGGCCRRAAC